MLLFVLASVACGLASSLPLLIAARLVQGVGAALVAPTSLSLIREAYDDTGERARALGYWALGGSLAAAAGPIVGGALALVNWLLIFFLNLPVGLIALGVLRAVAPSPRRAASFDWLGQLTAFVTMAGFYGTVFLQSLYFPQQRGLSALDSGLLFLPMTALVAVASPLVARVVRRVGPVAPIVGGSLGVAIFGAIVAVSAAFATGLRTSYVVTAGLLVVTTAATLTVRRPARQRAINNYRRPLSGPSERNPP